MFKTYLQFILTKVFTDLPCENTLFRTTLTDLRSNLTSLQNIFHFSKIESVTQLKIKPLSYSL